eukprot:CAMPEP_0170612268 /NCGR_PEP_ID=MMETSP0224-20130122/23634_1 /TAXON_ID=285029 /ORGANISM="Togula jolla, Strain CCCM 725" /LENGTH=338 /DNA_ID=CAMNT_0010937763 /DNA_START=59 /DNA_END=1075 /DNA_ORIENTATION=+
MTRLSLHFFAVQLILLMAVAPQTAAVGRRALLHELAVEAENVTDKDPVVQCEHIVASGRRVLLLSVTAAYHGSTSVLQLMMSSPNVSTLCANEHNWQCEGAPIMSDEAGWSDKIEKWQNWQQPLAHFSHYWDLSRPVFLEKTPNLIWAVEETYKNLSSVKMPPLMHSAGIKGLELAFIITWRPPCLASLSSHSYDWLAHGTDVWIDHEIEEYTRLVRAHQYLTELGVPTLVINIADTLWRQDVTLTRVKKFLPCAQGLDFDYLPEMGEDVFKGNRWKLESSLAAYGKSLDPTDCCGYDVRKTECYDESKWPALRAAERQPQFVELMDYLRDASSVYHR